MSGGYNSGYGALSLYSNTTGFNNSAFGYYSLIQNTTGNNNAAFGNFSLLLNSSGYRIQLSEDLRYTQTPPGKID